MKGLPPIPPRVVGVTLAIVAATVIGDLLPYSGTYPVPEGWNPLDPLTLLTQGTWLAVAIISAWRRETAPFAWLVVLSSFADRIWELGWIPTDVTWLISWQFAGLSAVVVGHLIVAFPTGRLRSRFDRRLVGLLYLYVLGTGVIDTLFWNPIYTCNPGEFCPRNPLVVWPIDGFRDVVIRATALLNPLIGGGVLYALWRHWRAAGPVGRRVLRPVVLGAPVVYLVVVVGYLADAFGATAISAFIRSTPVSLTAQILPVAFLIGAIQGRLARGAAADLAVELAQGVPLGGLEAALARSLRDPSLQLRFPAPDGADWVDAEGRPASVASAGPDRSVRVLERDGARLAALVYDPAIEAENPGQIERVAAVARLALENERLSAQVRAQLEEVRASRARIVEAADAERRRVERDLHDGAQQRLVALAMRLQVAREQAGGAAALLDEATAELQDAIAEVRSLARGLHPTILTEAGLAAALEALAERSAVPVRVVAPAERFAPVVEATAYYVVAEALTNVARYAGASRVTVTVTRAADGLAISVSDDGRGGADPDAGTGLRGLADRLATLGGRLTVTSPPGGGTTLVAELPAT